MTFPGSRVWQPDCSGDILSPLLRTELTILTTSPLTLGCMNVCYGTTANYTVTLPPVANCAGSLIGIRIATTTTKLVTMSGLGSDVIDGAATRPMIAGEVAILYSNGSVWSKIAGKTVPVMGSLYMNSTNQTFAANGYTKILFDTNLGYSTPLAVDAANARLNVLRTSQYLLYGSVDWASISATWNLVLGYNDATWAGAASETRSTAAYGQGIQFNRQTYISVGTMQTLCLFGFFTAGAPSPTIRGSVTTGCTNTFFGYLELPTW